MKFKTRVLLSIAPLVLLALSLSVRPVRSQPLSEDGVRVISLSTTGRERANAVVFSPDGKQIAAGTSAGIQLFDVQSLSLQGSIATGAWVRSLDFSPNGNLLAGGLFDNTTRSWSFPGLQERTNFGELDGWVRSVAFSPDGTLLAAAGGDGVRVWTVSDGRLVLEFPGLEGIRSLAISPNGVMLALGLMDNSIQLRSLSDGSLLRTLTGHEGWIRCLAFSPDGSQLASGAFDATARLWDINTGRLQFTLTDHDSSVLGIDYSPDGTRLATGSVDRTVRVWDPAAGTLLRTLVGHSGFVYSVAFSPDGSLLASGAEDNSVRLWDVNSVEDGAAMVAETPSDCRACHHPLSANSPVAVVDVRCDACHPNSLGVNWCPFFPRSAGNDKLPIVSASHETAGVAGPTEELAVTIFSPANGEVFYAYKDVVAPLEVRGRVDGPGAAPEEIELNLEVWEGTELVTSLTKTTHPNGEFTFNLGVNPHGDQLRINDPAAPLNCAFCHDDFFVEARLPAGNLHLRVTASTTDGVQAQDERWIITDVNTDTPQVVTIREASTGLPVKGITVQASTRLYEWRGRTFTGLSREDGIASMELEVLSQAPTVYTLTIPDQVVDGVFYSIVRREDITVAAGSAALAPITLEVTSQMGTVNGKIQGTNPGQIEVWAVQLPGGPWVKTEADTSGGFSFSGLPVGKYAVLADPLSLAGLGIRGAPTTLDLTVSPTQTVIVEMLPAGAAHAGMVTGADGEWLPFSWVTAPDGSAGRVDVDSGRWTLNPAPDVDPNGWVAGSPGYYSLKMGSPDLTAVLEARPELKTLAWGEGGISLPAETRARAGEGNLDFERGWVWGSNPVKEPFTIHTEQAEISLSSGRFALEQAMGEIGWFYLFEGTADLRIGINGETQVIHAGEMVPLISGGGQSLPYNAMVLPAFHPQGKVQDPVWKPGFFARVQTLTGQTGVLLAQLVTFITYLIALISLVGIPWFVIRWMQRRSRGEHINDKH